MRRVLITGMSGTESPARRWPWEGCCRVVDTDEPGWTQWSDHEGGYVWREDRITELLAGEAGPSLYVRGRCQTKAGSIRALTPSSCSSPLPRSSSRVSRPEHELVSQEPRAARTILRDLAEANRCCVEPAPTRSTLHSRSRASLTNLPNSSSLPRAGMAERLGFVRGAEITPAALFTALVFDDD